MERRAAARRRTPPVAARPHRRRRRRRRGPRATLPMRRGRSARVCRSCTQRARTHAASRQARRPLWCDEGGVSGRVARAHARSLSPSPHMSCLPLFCSSPSLCCAPAHDAPALQASGSASALMTPSSPHHHVRYMWACSRLVSLSLSPKMCTPLSTPPLVETHNKDPSSSNPKSKASQ